MRDSGVLVCFWSLHFGLFHRKLSPCIRYVFRWTADADTYPGLTAQQAMACVVIGAIITGMLSVVCGIAGEVHHIGYTVLARSHWGMKGAYFVSASMPGRRWNPCTGVCHIGPELLLMVSSPSACVSSRPYGGLVSNHTGVRKPSTL